MLRVTLYNNLFYFIFTSTALFSVRFLFYFFMVYLQEKKKTIKQKKNNKHIVHIT